VDPVQRRSLAKATPEAIVQQLLDGDSPGESYQQLLVLESQSADAKNTGLYRTWQLRRMVESPHPYREMMTLFWLDLFAISALRTKDTACYHSFCCGLQERALSPWDEILGFCLEHPAFLLNLRAERNYRSMPNHQLGEFVVEHLMGRNPGQERECVSNIARTYTGLFVRNGELRRYDYEHDPTVKVLGKDSGDFWPGDVAQVLARDASVATVLAGRLYRWFIGSDGNIPPGFVQSVVDQILAGRPTGTIVAEAIVSSSKSAQARARRIKSPLEVFLAVARPLKARVTTALAELLAELGWDILHPPTYAGWPKGRDWLTTSQLVRRVSLIESLLLKEDRFGGGVDVVQAARTAGYGDDWPGFLVDALLGDGIPAEVKGEWERHVQQGPSAAVLFLVSLPEFQLS
jgi:uncharacterized protein (DUF1800 family)